MFFFFFEEDFSKRLAATMEERGLDHVALAMISNVSPRTIKHWLDGKFEPRHRNLAPTADALGVSADYLLGRT